MSRSANTQVTILLAGGQPIYQWGLKSLLGVEEDLRVIATVSGGPEVLAAVLKFHPDVLLLDNAIQDRHPLDVIREVRQAEPHTQVLLLGDSVGDEEKVEAIRSGARAALSKEVSPNELLSALRKVLGGETLLEGRAITQMVDQLAAAGPPEPAVRLTTRELEIVNQIAQGFRNKEIAARLFISEQTVKNILRNVFDKLGVSDRLELALYAIHHRLFPAVPKAGPATRR